MRGLVAAAVRFTAVLSPIELTGVPVIVTDGLTVVTVIEEVVCEPTALSASATVQVAV